ncbi:MAG: hypothetical protein LBE62_12210 [Azonexus sp.]|jgi:hypothetical protein|nr:hypothetical protein [Azonexus sp.]
MNPATPHFQIAAARGALASGQWAVSAAFFAAACGWWLAASDTQTPLASALLTAISTASGLAALWYAMRIAIDQWLFAALAERLDAENDISQTLAGLDQALASLGWSAAANRPLDQRVRATTRFLRASLLIAAGQWLAVGVALAVGGF